MNEERSAPVMTLRDVMTRDVIAIDVNDTLDVIAGLFEKYDYEGMPVIDSQHALKGIITKHDMVLQSSEVHLPTMLRLIEQITKGKGDQRALDAHFGKLRNIKATSIMDLNPISLPHTASLEEASNVFADYPRTSTICVVDEQKKLVGIISHADVIRFFNQAYLKRAVANKMNASDHAYAQYPTKSESDVEKAFADVQREFLLVQRDRPIIWQYVALAMFAAGLFVATAFIIKFATK